MKMKLFYASGAQQILDIERETNAWLKEMPLPDKIFAVNTASGINGDIPSVTITVWYEDAPKRAK